MVATKGAQLSEYEEKRLRQIRENNEKLSELGIQPRVAPIVKKEKALKEKAFEKTRMSLRKREAVKLPSRYQFRSREASVKKTFETEYFSSEENEVSAYKSKYSKWERGNVFGAIPGIPIGATWDFRMEASYCGVHRPTVSGIAGSQELGCYSIALSGGYEDDVDEGEVFTYTGSGGRDLRGTKNKPKNLRTAPQSSDQVFERNNLALKISHETEKPVRVIRGYKLDSPYAPAEGYRYDGLYKVIKVWRERGSSGYLVCRFKLKRLPNQDPLPVSPVVP
ncbi:hypothetical protein DSO57_1034530 [Entomophthora muscae]|uniref:Uncharacterized protein n=1 Tax=Entomophthora muscae TaxID=34485 RepID=A0ACC2RQU1_9FUNG|nr:hypothetical protein DSO57_1034530 [Entomophthora muscae]